jgi:Cytochrome c7 and related cytochrome c
MRRVLIIFCVVGLGAGLSLGGWGLARVGVHQGYSPVQPIAFSHKVHAGENKIPCLYCHFGARKSRHAGIPAESVCMNCHSILQTQAVEIEKLKEADLQRRAIPWIRVHKLPDFVYFNHSQHVLSGLECQRCHGRVETMDRVTQVSALTMGWCLECHRARAGIPTSPVKRAALSLRQQLQPIPGLECGKCHY